MNKNLQGKNREINKWEQMNGNKTEKQNEKRNKYKSFQSKNNLKKECFNYL
jgi:hypothetical protein